MKNTVATFQEMKQKGEKISMLTCYDYSTAKLMDEAGVNSLLIGDSLGNVILGYEDTLSVTMEDMIHHTAPVARGAKNALVIADMPFMSYQASVYDAVTNAGRLMKEGRANAVKLDGGHKVQGKSAEAAREILEDAKRIEEAGAFAVVLECIPADLARKISETISIPTIGIGAGPGCDGQVLVYQDMLALFSDFKPKFVKNFANIGEQMTQAFKDYDAEVKANTFPAAEHCFKDVGEEVLDKLY